jgi:AcrR family transcriptional regulator
LNDNGVKERVLRAAIHEFGVTGYHLTSLRTIAERSGSNKPMIYYHFQGKEGLYLAAVRRLIEETAAVLREALAAEAPALVKLRRFAEVNLDAFLVSRPMMGTVLRELSSLLGPLYHAIAEEYNDQITSQLRRILAEGVEHGEFGRLDIDGCISGIIALLHGFVRYGSGRPDGAVRTAISQLMDYYALGLLSREALAERLARRTAASGS